MFPFPIIEKISLVAPLGLCFHDAATGERIADGLSVSVYPAAATISKKKSAAFVNRSGVYVLHKVPGLGEFTRGTGDADFWKENPPQKPYTVEVFDHESRFQPFRFTVELPVKGIYQWENIPPTSPNRKISSVPLYSAPTRKTLGGMAVVRAELRESEEKAASFAVLEARFNSDLVARGIADREGRIVLMFPALSPQNNPFTSPPTDATRVSLADQKWDLDFSIRYEPKSLESAPPSKESDEAFLPDLRLVLDQKKGKLFANAEKNKSFTTAVLRVGKELILRSREAQAVASPPDDEPAFSSYLFVNPA